METATLSAYLGCGFIALSFAAIYLRDLLVRVGRAACPDKDDILCAHFAIGEGKAKEFILGSKRRSITIAK
jgi:hypothetical protein